MIIHPYITRYIWLLVVGFIVAVQHNKTTTATKKKHHMDMRTGLKIGMMQFVVDYKVSLYYT